MPSHLLLLCEPGPERDRLEDALRLLGVPLRTAALPPARRGQDPGAERLPGGAELILVGSSDLEELAVCCALVRAAAPEAALLACLLAPGEGGAAAAQRALGAGADDLLLGVPPEGVILSRVVAASRVARGRKREERAGALQRALRQIVELVATSAPPPPRPSAVSLSDGVPLPEGAEPRALLRLFHQVLGLAVDAIGWDHGALLLGDEGADTCSFLLLCTTADAERTLLPLRAADYPSLAQALRGGDRTSLSGALERGRLAASALLPQRGALLGLPLRGAAADAESLGDFLLLLQSDAPGARLDAEAREFLCTAAQVTALSLRGQGAVQSLRDQTQRVSLNLEGHRGRRAAARRREALSQYREFFEASADGVLVLDDSGGVQYLNRIAEQITGYSAEGLVDRSLLPLVPAPQREGLLEAVRQVVAQVTLHPFDLQLTTTSGETLVLSVSASSALAEHRCALLSFRDVTEQRILEHELRSTKDFLERLIDSTVDGIIAADMDGNVVLFNRGAARLTGYLPEEVIGKVPVWYLYPEGEAREIMADLRSGEHGGVGRLQQSRRTLLGKGGALVPVSLTAAIVYDAGREVATVGVVSDLRERLRIEERLQETQERLAQSEKQALLAELAGAAAHELNQPLTSVMGYAGLLRRKLAVASPDLMELPDILVREAERMAEIVRKIGRITRYETKPYVGEVRILDLDKSTEATPTFGTSLLQRSKEGR